MITRPDRGSNDYSESRECSDILRQEGRWNNVLRRAGRWRNILSKARWRSNVLMAQGGGDATSWVVTRVTF